MKISVIICTYNPRKDYLDRTLEGLRRQSMPVEEWELLLIDNCSKEPLEGRFDLSWHPRARVVREEELGLTAARMRGIRESSGNLLLFVDDDNVLDEHYLRRADLLMDSFPNLGCIGAAVIAPEFEEEPADDLRFYTNMLALRQTDEVRWSNDPSDSAVPWGAGMVVSREVAIAHEKNVATSEVRQILDRKGEGMNSCGDDEFSWTACAIGKGKGIFPELKVLHLIDRKRVQREYLIKLAEGHTYSRALLHWIHRNEVPAVASRPTGQRVIRALFAGKLSQFFGEGHRWWTRKRREQPRADFEDAWAAGRERAARFLATLDAGKRKSIDD